MGKEGPAEEGGLGLQPLPPLPLAEGHPAVRGGSLLRAVATAETGLVRIEVSGGEAMLAFASGRLVDACSGLDGKVTTGPAVLDQLEGCVPSAVEVSAVPEQVARALPWYWRAPLQVRALPARVTDAAGFIRSLLREDQSGVVLVETPEDLGLLFFAAGSPIAVYTRQEPTMAGIDALDGLCSDTSALLHARLLDSGGAAAAERAVQSSEQVMERIEQLCRERLKMHAATAIKILRPAVLGKRPLAEATGELASLRLRLVSPATMAELAERARKIIEAEEKPAI